MRVAADGILSMEPRSSLFRSEVVEQGRDRLHGEIVFTQPLSARFVVAALVAIVAGAAIWVSVGTYARIESVSGVLVTSLPSAKVVALQPGVVSSVAVKEGQSVRRGDKLLVINSDREAGEGGVVAGRELGSLMARQRLTDAQVTMAGSKAVAERARLASLINSSEQQALDLRDQIALQKQIVASNKQVYEQITAVVEQGFVSKLELERRRLALLTSQQTLSSLSQRLTATMAEAQQAREQLASDNIEVEQGISQIRESQQALSGEQARLEGQKSYTITAPIDGRVTALVTGVGRSIQVSRPLMVIVADSSELKAELYAPSRAIGFVEPGKETRLLYDAFPYQRFGSFAGKVESISRVAIDSRETEIPFEFKEPVYRIIVTLEQQRINAFGSSSPLQPGMTLKANIVLERQSFLDWLLQPLNAVLNRTS